MSAERVKRLVEAASAFSGDPNDDEKRLAYLKATFNLDRTASLIVALATERDEALGDAQSCRVRALERTVRAQAAEAALRCAIDHIEHMAAWISARNAGYSFESISEDMPGLKDALAKARGEPTGDRS